MKAGPVHSRSRAPVFASRAETWRSAIPVLAGGGSDGDGSVGSGGNHLVLAGPPEAFAGGDLGEVGTAAEIHQDVSRRGDPAVAGPTNRDVGRLAHVGLRRTPPPGVWCADG